MLSESVTRKRLLGWFKQNKRELPWRDNKDPYRIWLSEVIMQQTRVAQGTPYYLRFIELFPSVEDLALASEQEVLRAWQGLGYYSRARNLHAAAKEVVEKHGGKFPPDFSELLKLKGIGEYTAAAIASIAFNHPYAALDGNVYRVLSRLYAEETPINIPAAKKHFTALGQKLLDKKHHGDYNEAMMEFGATICTPKNPLCEECPLQSECLAYSLGKVDELPKKIAARPVTERWLHYLYMHTADGLYISRRGEGDIWQGLYELPLIEKSSHGDLEINDLQKAGFPKSKPRLLQTTKHRLTHRLLHISFYEVKLDKQDKKLKAKYEFVVYSELDKYPLPRPIEAFFSGLKHL